MSNEALADRSGSRLVGVVGGVDRAFPVLWLGLYLLLPVSGWASEMFESWFDQMRDLEALGSLVADGHADAIASSGIGPAYLGVAALVHDVLGLSLEDSLVVLTRASYALSVAAALILVRVLVGRATGAPAIVSLASQLGLVGLVFAAGTWYWSDVPWSHFFAAALAVAVYAVRFAPRAPSTVGAVATGGLLALLAATRSFELLALVVAWAIVAAGVRVARIAEPWRATRAAAGAGAFVLTTLVVYAATGKRDLFFLYEKSLDSQSGSLGASDVAQTPTLSVAFLPTKLIQLVFDPCYLSLCETSDYATGGGGGQNVDLWSLPLAIQLPALLLLPACAVALVVLVVRSLVRRTRPGSATRPLAEMTIAAGGLVLGYASSTLTGPGHLQYGFARDFILPALLLSIVSVVLGSIGLWALLAHRGRPRISSEVAFVAATFIVVVGAVTATTIARTSGLPRVESKHLGQVVYSARCAAQTCGVTVAASTTGGDAIAIPAESTLTFGCDGGGRLTLYAASLGDVEVASSCLEPRLVAAWPTVMGLPPGELELAAVDVRNV